MNIFFRPDLSTSVSSHSRNAFTAFAAFAVLFLAAGYVSAATLVVTNTNDSGPGSLRQAVLDANVNVQDDVINFDPAVFSTPQTIVLTSGQIFIGNDYTSTAHQLVINGPGADLLTLDGNNHSRIFEVADDGAATIDGLKLTHGNGFANSSDPNTNSNGGAIRSAGGSNGLNLSNLTLTNSLITDNTAVMYLGSGGGVIAFGQVTIVNCDINHNVSSTYGGGLAGGYIAWISNSTFSYNTSLVGSGISFEGSQFTLVNSTVAFNANYGGGLSLRPFATFPKLDLINSIVSNNDRPGINGDINGTLTSSRNSIIGSALGLTITNDLGGNLMNVDPKLLPDPIQVPGGNSGLRFRFDSPAIDAGSNCVLTPISSGGCSPLAVTTDYRGVTRPQDGNGDGIATVDIGNFEALRSEVLATPAASIDLQAASDTGSSDTDNVTSIPDLTFVLTGVSAGTAFEVSRDGFVIASGVSDGQPFTFEDHISFGGLHTYTPFRVVNGIRSVEGAQLTVIYDNVPPSVSIGQAPAQTDPTRIQPIRFTVTFSEPVSGFDQSDISLAGSTAGVSAAVVTVSGSGSVYTVQISNITANGTVVLNVTTGAAKDAAGNSSSAATIIDNAVLYDTTRAYVTAFDFDGDGRADESLFRPTENNWYLNRSQNGFTGFQFGAAADTIAPADFTGDGKTDVAVFRPSTGFWYVLRSEDNTLNAFKFGMNGDIPAPGDFDGDGKADFAVYRPGEGRWYLQQSTAGYADFPFGTPEDKPTLGDFDGDLKADIAVFRPSNGVWYRINSSSGAFVATQFGQTGDKVVAADYTGDGKTDIAVWRPSNGTWYVLRSEEGSFYGQQFGLSDDLPTPGDYDGDGKADVAVFRPSSGTWYEQRSTSGLTAVQFGMNGDKPAPNAFVY